MIEIEFTSNWNGGKLNLDNFTTIRRSTTKYQLGDKVDIYLRKNKHERILLCSGYIKRLQVLTLSELLKKEWICILDTGYDSQGTKEIIEGMYQGIKDSDLMVLLLISVTKRHRYVTQEVQKDLFDDTDSFLKSLNSDNMFNNEKF